MCRAAQPRRLPVQRASVLLLAIFLLFIALILASLVIDYANSVVLNLDSSADASIASGNYIFWGPDAASVTVAAAVTVAVSVSATDGTPAPPSLPFRRFAGGGTGTPSLLAGRRLCALP